MTQSQLDMAVNRYGFLSKVNISEENQHKPGTALLWKTSVPLSGVVNLVEGKLQMAELGQYRISNCYTPSGSGNKRGRSVFYGEDVFKYQPSGTGGTRSPPATSHRLQHLTARLIQKGRRGLERG